MNWVEREFVDEDFRDDDLAGLHTERVVFDGCDFSGVNMAESEHAGTASAPTSDSATNKLNLGLIDVPNGRRR